MLELEDRLLELAIEDDPVGDHHDLVEDRMIVQAVERHQPMGEPGDRVRLARAGRMLDEVALARAFVARRRLHPSDGIPLVIARKDRRARPHLRGMGRAFAGHDVDEPAQQVQPGVASPDLLPEVSRPVAVGIGRVALAAGVAAVERQKARLLAREPCRHLDRLGIDREVHERPTAEGDVGRVAIGSVLVLGVLDGLVRERVLQLRRGDRDAVDEEAQVQGLRRRRLVWELARDGEAVGEVSLGQFGREAVGRLEERQADLDAVVVDAMAQDIDRAALVDLLGQSIGELLVRAGFAAVDRDEPLPSLGLRLGQESEQLGCVEPARPIEVGRPLGLRAPLADPVSALLDEAGRDRILEPALRDASCGHSGDLDLACNGRSDERLATLSSSSTCCAREADPDGSDRIAVPRLPPAIRRCSVTGGERRRKVSHNLLVCRWTRGPTPSNAVSLRHSSWGIGSA